LAHHAAVTARFAAALASGLLLVACAAPATEEGFNRLFCEADVALEVAITEVTGGLEREEWLSATRSALLDYRDDLDRLPDWPPARDAKGELMNALDAALDLIESGAAGELIESARWEDAIDTMLSAREAIRTVAGPCLRV
jgi:hypothetical protein